MGSFPSFDELQIHFDIHGSGPPVLLIHSFGFDSELWVGCGVVEGLTTAGRTAITIDLRGHGRSDRPHEASRYGAAALARDVVALLDHLALGATDLVSYSLGSYVALRVLQLDRRIRAAVLGGVGGDVLDHRRPDPSLFPVAPDRATATAWMDRYFPYLGDRIHRGVADPQALVEVQRAGCIPDDKDFNMVTAAVLLLIGSRDDDPQPLAAAMPRAQVQTLDADHATTMDHPNFTTSIVSFLNQGELPPAVDH